MKQNITIEQLNELSDKGKERLRDWWKPTGLELIIYQFSKGWEETENYPDGEYGCLVEPDHPENKGNALPRLSIGQMIEFLDEYDPSSIGAEGGYWWDYVLTISDNQIVPSGGYNENFLCDALWQAVKEILEKE